MKLYLVRHGECVDQGPDDERCLTEEGEIAIKRLADFIAPLKLPVIRLLCSPKQRARQTAELLKPALFMIKQEEVTTELQPSASPEAIIGSVFTWEEDTMLVSHLPFLGRLASQLLSGDENGIAINWVRGCMVCLERLQYGPWSLSWMLVPNMLL